LMVTVKRCHLSHEPFADQQWASTELHGCDSADRAVAGVKSSLTLCLGLTIVDSES